MFIKFYDVQLKFSVLPQFPWDIYKYLTNFAIKEKLLVYIQTKRTYKA